MSGRAIALTPWPHHVLSTVRPKVRRCWGEEMRRVVVAAGMSLALLAGPGHAQTSPGTPDPQARELAQAIVAADGDRARLSKLISLDLIITDQTEKALDVADPVKKDRIGAIVHNRMQALEDDLIEAKVSALTQTFTIQELEGALAFDRSPSGQALRRAAPELNRELASAAFGQGAPAAEGPPPSGQKLALINRVLKARGVENSAHKGWRVLNTMMTKAFAEASGQAAPIAATANDQAAEDAYVKRVVAVETQFYAKTFSDEQLTEIAAYFEGPIGCAFAERASQITSAGLSAASKIFERQFERMDEEACEAVGCSASQRLAIDTQLDKIRSMMATG